MTMRTLFIGLSGAGKTSCLNALLGLDWAAAAPTAGFAMKEVKTADTEFAIVDLGGNDKIRPYWDRYYKPFDGVLFFVDACDAVQLPRVRDALLCLLTNDTLRHSAVVVCLNKCDRTDATAVTQEQLQAHIDHLSRARLTPVQYAQCSAARADTVLAALQRCAGATRELSERMAKLAQEVAAASVGTGAVSAGAAAASAADLSRV